MPGPGQDKTEAPAAPSAKAMGKRRALAEEDDTLKPTESDGNPDKKDTAGVSDSALPEKEAFDPEKTRGKISHHCTHGLQLTSLNSGVRHFRRPARAREARGQRAEEIGQSAHSRHPERAILAHRYHLTKASGSSLETARNSKGERAEVQGYGWTEGKREATTASHKAGEPLPRCRQSSHQKLAADARGEVRRRMVILEDCQINHRRSSAIRTGGTEHAQA